MQLKKESPMKKNAGKIALAVSILAGIAMSIAFVAVQAPDRSAVEQVVLSSAALEKRFNAVSSDDAPKLPDVQPSLSKWQAAPPTREDLPAWIFNRRPEVTVKVKPPVDKRKDLFPPLEVKAVVVPDFRVELSWQADPRSTATVKGYKVFRWDEGADFPAKPLSEDLVEGTSFVDENPEQLLPLKKYSYSVRAVTEEEVKTPGGKEPGSAPVNVSMPDDRQVLYYGEGTVEMALLYVKRYFKGDWVEQKFSVYLGDFAGKEESVEVKGEKTKVDFALGRILADIAQEVRKEMVDVKVQKRDDQGKPVFDEKGQPVYENKQREISKMEEFIVLIDPAGDELRVRKTEKIIPPPPNPEIDAPFYDHFFWDLQMRLRQAPDPILRRSLQRRVIYLQRFRPKLVGEPADVDRNLLEKKGLLYEKRWEWLLAKRQAAKFKNRPDHVRAADELGDNIRDLETFLTPEGWDKEKAEWERDYREFERTFPDTEPAAWSMAPRPEAPKNTAEKKK